MVLVIDHSISIHFCTRHMAPLVIAEQRHFVKNCHAFHLSRIVRDDVPGGFNSFQGDTGAAEPVRQVRFWPDHFSAIE